MIPLPFVSAGINIMKRKMAEHDNLKVTIEQTGDKFHIKESSTFRTKEIDFTLGVQFDYTLADGTEVSVRGRGGADLGSRPVETSLLIPVKPTMCFNLRERGRWTETR